LLIATSVTDPGSRPAARQAFSISARTSRKPRATPSSLDKDSPPLRRMILQQRQSGIAGLPASR
jgi:hypothetical protein